MSKTYQPQTHTHHLLREMPQAVAVTDLLAVATGVSAETAAAVLSLSNGSLRTLKHVPSATVSHLAGEDAAARLAATLELCVHYRLEDAPTKVSMRGPKDVAASFAPRLEDLPVEEFHVAILDSQHRLARDVLITRGLLNSSLVHPREVFAQAIAERAAAIILVHNHPSGDPTPSAEDRAVTETLVAAGRLLDIPVHDHVVIGRGQYVSFAEQGLL